MSACRARPAPLERGGLRSGPCFVASRTFHRSERVGVLVAGGARPAARYGAPASGVPAGVDATPRRYGRRRQIFTVVARSSFAFGSSTYSANSRRPRPVFRPTSLQADGHGRCTMLRCARRTYGFAFVAWQEASMKLLILAALGPMSFVARAWRHGMDKLSQLSCSTAGS